MTARTFRTSLWDLRGILRPSKSTRSKTAALKRARSLARKHGYSEQGYTVLARRRAGLCVLEIRFNGGLSTKDNPSPRGVVALLGWGRSWRIATSRANDRLRDEPMTPPAVLMRWAAS